MNAAASRATSSERVAGARFVNPSVLARIGNLELLARTVVDGFVSGLHRAFFTGVSTDFAEHRAYVPGDDVRRIDWLLWARTDRLYVKTYESETNADLVIALDVSRSMDFASASLTKLDYARYLAASLAWLAGRQRDRVGVATFDADLVEVVPPAVRHRDLVLQTLDRAAPGGRGDLERSLGRLGAALRRRGIIVVISDFYAEPADAAAALDELRARGHDVVAFQVLDPLERDLDLEGVDVFEDLETGERLPVVPRALREEYGRLVEAHVGALGRELGRRSVDYACLDTTAPLDHALFHYLSDRARLARVR